MLVSQLKHDSVRSLTRLRMTPAGARDKLIRCNALRELSMSIVENAVREIDEQGFTILPNLLSADEVDEIVDGIRGLDKPTTHDIISRTRVADRLATHPSVLAVVRGAMPAHVPDFNLKRLPKGTDKKALAARMRFFERGIQLAHSSVKNMKPGAEPGGLHYDDSLFGIPRPHHRLMVNTLTALVPFNAETGATRVVPGSHRWDLPVDHDHPTVTVEMDAGSMVLFDGGLWHGQGHNTSGRIRYCLNLFYARSWLRKVDNHYWSLDPTELSEEMQELLFPMEQTPITTLEKHAHQIAR